MTISFSSIKNRRQQALAYHYLPHRDKDATGHMPGIVFMGGFRSDMTGTKATFLEQKCQEAGCAFLRFDYSGHGQSEGVFEDGTLSDWIDDALDCLDQITTGPQILVGSSMGGWIMLHVALRRPERIAGLVGIAAAPDFTEDLMWAHMTEPQRTILMRDGRLEQPNHYSPDPYIITRRLIEDGRNHLLMRGPINIPCPVRLIYGMADRDVPWSLSCDLAERLTSDDVQIRLIKNGDHRLSSGPDVELLWLTCDGLRTALFSARP